MKSLFNEKSVVLSELQPDSCALIISLQSEGFLFNVAGSTLKVCELEYPLYTSKNEARAIYKQVQKKLCLVK
jgi:hypothetical protein